MNVRELWRPEHLRVGLKPPDLGLFTTEQMLALEHELAAMRPPAADPPAGPAAPDRPRSGFRTPQQRTAGHDDL